MLRTVCSGPSGPWPLKVVGTNTLFQTSFEWLNITVVAVDDPDE